MSTELSNKFGLIDSMMNRLEITPSVMTLMWLRECNLVLGDIIKNLPQESINNNFTSLEAQESETVVSEEPIKEKSSTTVIAEEPADIADKKSDEQEKNVAQPFEGEFFSYDIPSVSFFELNAETISFARCGMFVYAHGDSFIITRNPIQQDRDYYFRGILFDRQEDTLLALKICELHSGYGRALKKLSSNYRFLNYQDCEKMFVYQKRLKDAFKKMHIKVKGREKVFYQDPQSPKNACVFDLQQGTTEIKSSLSATSYQVITVKFN